MVSLEKGETEIVTQIRHFESQIEKSFSIKSVRITEGPKAAVQGAHFVSFSQASFCDLMWETPRRLME